MNGFAEYRGSPVAGNTRHDRFGMHVLELYQAQAAYAMLVMGDLIAVSAFAIRSWGKIGGGTY